MDREIKYRAIADNLDKFVHGFYYEEVNPETDRISHFIQRKQFIDGEFSHTTTFFVDPDTLGQYTGLKDKNGTEIYEGDIVKGENYMFPCYDDRNLEVSYSNKEQAFSTRVMNKSDIEVIGNIHENPDLL